MLVTSKEMLEKARREHYAVPAMNTQGGNYDIIWAICRAAEEMHSPAILAHYVATGAYSGDDWFVEVCKWCANKVSVPIAIRIGLSRLPHPHLRGNLCRADPERGDFRGCHQLHLEHCGLHCSALFQPV